MGFMPSIANECVHASSEGRLHFALPAEDLCDLVAVLRFVQQIETRMEAPLTEQKARPLIHSLRPGNAGQFNLDHYSEVLAKRFTKTFEAALKKKVEGVSAKYRRQVRDLLAQRAVTAERPAFQGANPASEPADVAALLRFAIENESNVDMHYLRATQKETVERVRPESLNNDKLFAFSESRQSYCAYRLARVRSARLL